MSHTHRSERTRGHLDELGRRRKQQKINRDMKADPLYLDVEEELNAAA